LPAATSAEPVEPHSPSTEAAASQPYVAGFFFSSTDPAKCRLRALLIRSDATEIQLSVPQLRGHRNLADRRPVVENLANEKWRHGMAQHELFANAFPFQKDILALPVADLDATAKWYGDAFGMNEVERFDTPSPTVVLERDGVRIGFAINGADPAQDGAAILVTDIHAMQKELESKGVETGNSRVDMRDGKKLQVFFVVAPDGLCYYFHQPIEQ
jgi:catechol 2,3-dioxygenase-like lactoylglutathione lyase family enzyme